MNRILISGIAVCILVFAGGIAAFIRYKYTRPDTRDIKLIVSATIAVAVIFNIVVLTLPQMTAPAHTSSISASNAHNQRSSIGSAIVKIATDLSISGADQASVKLLQNGAKLAVDQANQNHEVAGVTLVFDPKDDAGSSGTGDPTIGAHNVTEFVADAEVAGIVGPFDSSVAKAEMPITNLASLAQISPANTDPCLTKDTAASGCSGANDLLSTLRPTGRVNYFRVVTTDDNQGLAGADYMAELGYKKVYVIDDAETYGMGNANAFIGEWQKLNLTVLGHASEPGTTTSYVPLLMQIASSHPDLIYFGGIDSTGGTLMRQQMQRVPGLQNLPFASDDGIVTPAFASAIQPLGGGDSYATAAVVGMATNPDTANFRQQYATAFPNEPISVESAAAYDSANILIQAIKTAIQNGVKPPTSSSDSADAITFRTAVISAVQSISYDGVTGHQSFDSNGDTQLKTISIYKLGLNSSHAPDWIDATAINVT